LTIALKLILSKDIRQNVNPYYMLKVDRLLHLRILTMTPAWAELIVAAAIKHVRL
jgi:hypothetical protein